MKKCAVCHKPFKPRTRDRVCSLGCKLLKSCVETRDGCLLFENGLPGVYGRFLWRAKNYQADRVSYELFVGEFEAGRFVCHRCGIPKCVNSDHLFLGSFEDRKKCISDRKIAETSGFPLTKLFVFICKNISCFVSTLKSKIRIG